MTTNCVSPPELDDKQLLAFLDGEGDKETASHLERCAFCREKAETLARLQRRLTTRLYRLTCPSPIELGEYYLRMLPASQMLITAQHVRGCPHCAREIVQLEDFLRELRPTSGNGLLGTAKLLIAKLVDEQQGIEIPPVVPALRGHGKRPLTFAAEGIVIVLDIEPATEGRKSILGQLAAENQDEWTGALVELREDSQLQVSSTIDDLGAFQFEVVSPGSVQMTITSPQGILVQIANIHIGN